MESLRSAANDCSARNSCTNPRIALSNTIARIAPASIQSSSRPDMAAAPIRTQMMRLENWRKKIFSGEGRAASGSSFGPTVVKRWRASGVLSPISLSDWSSCLSCYSLSVCHVFVIVTQCYVPAFASQCDPASRANGLRAGLLHRSMRSHCTVFLCQRFGFLCCFRKTLGNGPTMGGMLLRLRFSMRLRMPLVVLSRKLPLFGCHTQLLRLLGVVVGQPVMIIRVDHSLG